MPDLSSGMAFVFDSLAPLILFTACISAWTLAGGARAAVRVNIRFSAMLFAALPAARGLGLLLPQFAAAEPAVALIAASLGVTALALGLFALLAHPLPAGAAALALGLSLGAGLAAALSGVSAYAFLCQIPGVSLTLAAGFSARTANRLRAALALMAALSLLCGGLVLMDGAGMLTEIFFAAALISAGRASSPHIESGTKPQRLAAVGLRG